MTWEAGRSRDVGTDQLVPVAHWSIPILSRTLRRAKVRENGDLRDKTLRDYLAQSLIHPARACGGGG